MATKELLDLRTARDWKGVQEHIYRELVSYPEDAELWFCLSEAYGAQDKYPEALQCAMKSLSFDPMRYQAWAFLGNAQAGLGNWPGVESAAKRALDILPGLPQGHWLLAHAGMARNDHKTYWENVQYGILCEKRKVRGITAKAWKGEDAKGKVLLVYSEQGAGDAIQYARFLPLLKEKTGATIMFECRSAVVGLCQHLADMTIAEQPDRASVWTYDYHLPVMDVPRFLGLGTEDISGKPYLRAEEREDTKGKIGLVWKGFAGHANDKARSIPDEMLEEFKDVADFMAIQPGATCPEWLPDAPLSDYQSTANALIGLKLLVTVDTSTAHIAGALGVPTIMIAPIGNTEPRWAWGDKTPWYDSWTIIHASTHEEAILNAKRAVKEFFKEK